MSVASVPNDDLLCNVAAQWVDEHRDALPTTLASISELPVVYRRAVFAAHSPEIRARLFSEHLQTFLESPSLLTDNQMLRVREVMDMLPDLYKAEEGSEIFLELEQMLALDFDQPTASMVFGTLGPPSRPGDVDFANCNCHQGSLCSCMTSTGPEEECDDSDCSTGGGCGCLWFWTCNGICCPADADDC